MGDRQRQYRTDFVYAKKTKGGSPDTRRSRHAEPTFWIYRPSEVLVEENERSMVSEGVTEVLEYLGSGVETLRTKLFGYLAADTPKSFRGLAAEETNNLVIYVENTLFKLGKSTATNIVLDKCVDVLIQTMHFTHDELEQVRGDHRAEIVKLKAEQDKLQNANTILTELLQEYRDEKEYIESERDDALEHIQELDDKLKNSEQAITTLQKQSNQWHQKFVAADAKRLAAKSECDRLLQERDQLNQRLTEERNKQKFEEMRRKMEEFERQEAEAARRKREKEEKARREEEEKQRQEEKRRQEEEDIKRKAREKAEQERRAREAATAAEEERCRKRDATNWGEEPWTSNIALERFYFVAEEFTTTKYYPDKPITLWSIPWPALNSPSQFALDDLDWKTVEDFLRHARKLYSGQDSAKYGRLLKQLQLMFHPDRWSSRNLLLTVIDAELRDKLRQAGKIVSQAVNQWVHAESSRSSRET